MEITWTNPLRDTGVSKTTLRRERQMAPEQPSAPAVSDRLEVSRQTAEAVERVDGTEKSDQKESVFQHLRDKQNSLNELLEMLEDSEQTIKAAVEQAKAMLRCLKISAAIIRGDHVPPEDEQYLLEHEPEMHKMSVLLRRTKEDPEDCDSVLEDEEDQQGDGASAVAADGRMPAPEIAAPAEAAAPAEDGATDA